MPQMFTILLPCYCATEYRDLSLGLCLCFGVFYTSASQRRVHGLRSDLPDALRQQGWTAPAYLCEAAVAQDTFVRLSQDQHRQHWVLGQWRHHGRPVIVSIGSQ